MTRSLVPLIFLLLVCAGAPALAQGKTSTPVPAKTAPGAVPTLKTGAQLVIVDVVVTDSSRKPVHGLKASDFTLREGDTPQVIKNFEEHTALTPADATRFTEMPKLEPGIFTNYTPEPANGAVNLLLLDTLNTPLASQAYVRQQLLAYLKARPPGTRIAIFGLTTRLTVLQGFTSDPETLKNVMTKGLGKSSPLLNDAVPAEVARRTAWPMMSKTWAGMRTRSPTCASSSRLSSRVFSFSCGPITRSTR